MCEPQNFLTERSVCDLKSSKGDNVSLASRREQEEVLSHSYQLLSFSWREGSAKFRNAWHSGETTSEEYVIANSHLIVLCYSATGRRFPPACPSLVHMAASRSSPCFELWKPCQGGDVQSCMRCSWAPELETWSCSTHGLLLCASVVRKLCTSQWNGIFKSSYSFAKPNKAKCLKGKQYKYPVSLLFTQRAAGETGACELWEILKDTMVGRCAFKMHTLTPSLITCFACVIHILSISFTMYDYMPIKFRRFYFSNFLESILFCLCCIV